MTEQLSADSVRPALPQLVERLIEKWRADAAAVRRTLSPGTSLDVQRESLRHIIELERCANELEAALAAQGAPAWQPIETAPKDRNISILGWCEGWGQPREMRWVPRGAVGPIDYWYVPEGNIHFAEPTHWLPLPAPPRVGRAPHEEEQEK